MFIKTIALIGYSGHSYVVYDCFFSQGQIVTAYTDVEEKDQNPFALRYLGSEAEPDVMKALEGFDYFVSIGDNKLRKKITNHLVPKLGHPVIALHKSAILSRNIQSGEGVMISPRVVVNSGAAIGNGVILNTACIVEHECTIGDFAHIAPGAVLCGNVSIGECTLVGANAVVLPGIKIGNNAIIGAGSVVNRNVPDNAVYAGNPARKL